MENVSGAGINVDVSDVGSESGNVGGVDMSNTTNASGMDFGQALMTIKQGKKVTRKGWNGKGMWVNLAKPYEIHTENDLKTSRLFMELTGADGSTGPWSASNSDILAEDWEIVE